jgi:hypothetical protein
MVDFQRHPLHPSLPYNVAARFRVISILKPGKDPARPSSYQHISLLDTISKLFENILLARILHKVSVRGLMLDEQFGLDQDTTRRCSWPASLKE